MNPTDGEVEEYATATEVDGIRRTLDKFMKKQDERHDALEGTLDKLLLSLNKLTAQTTVPPPEDMGSNTKGKTIPITNLFKAGPSIPQNSQHINKSLNFGNYQQESQKHYYTPPHSTKAQIMSTGGPEWSTGGNNFVDLEYDFGDFPWDEQELEFFYEMANREQDTMVDHTAAFPPKQTNNNMFNPPRHIRNIPHPEGHFMQKPQAPPFSQHLLHQYRMVAKGPKLSFLEFDGSDPDGWFRKAEFFFEVVAVRIAESQNSCHVYERKSRILVEGYNLQFCYITLAPILQNAGRQI